MTLSRRSKLPLDRLTGSVLRERKRGRRGDNANVEAEDIFDFWHKDYIFQFFIGNVMKKSKMKNNEFLIELILNRNVIINFFFFFQHVRISIYLLQFCNILINFIQIHIIETHRSETF